MSKKEHRTVLYIPSECLQFSPEEASKDKQLLERMEGEATPTFRSPLMSCDLM